MDQVPLQSVPTPQETARKVCAIWRGMCGSGCWMNIKAHIQMPQQTALLYAQNLHVGKIIARGACVVAVAGTTVRAAFALRAATAAPPIFAASALAFVFAGPRSLEPLGPLLPWELISIEHLIIKVM